MNSSNDISQDVATVLAVQLIDIVFGNRERLEKAALAALKKLSVDDVAYLANRSRSTIYKWQEEGKIRMNVGPDGHLSMSYRDFEHWYNKAYQKPAPKL